MNARFERIAVKGFRCIDSVSIGELRRVNIVIGRGGSCKTSLLEAMYIASSPSTLKVAPYMESSLMTVVSGRRGYLVLINVRYSSATIDAGIRLGGSMLEVEAVVNQDGIVAYINGEQVDDDTILQLLAGHGLDVWRRPLSVYIWSDSSCYNKIESYLTGVTDVLIDSSIWPSIERRGLHTGAARLVSSCTYDRMTDVTLRGDELAARIETTAGPVYIPLRDIGDSVRRAILAYLVIEYLDPPIVIWDGIDAIPEPCILQRLIEWLVSSGRQVVASV